MATDLSGLKHFTKRLEAIGGQTNDFKHQLVKKITQRGKDIAIQEYSSSGIAHVTVTKHSSKNGTGQIIAEGQGVAYIEFGTGTKGMDSNYPEKHLPTQTIEFESPKGSPQSTQGWEYNYDNPQTKRVNEDGKIGWYFNGQFTEGREAGMQMYRTSKRLEQEMKSMVKEFVKEVKKNG